MAQQFKAIEPKHQAFIERQHIFFTASAAADGRINLSPKGLDALRVLGPNEVVYLDWTGSGNETAAHMLADGRLTIMFCAFQGPPMILRLYGKGRIHPKGSARYRDLLESAFNGQEPLGARQIVGLDIDLVQSSCGFGVPLFQYDQERTALAKWSESRGEEGLEAYRLEKNRISLDGLPTGAASGPVEA